MRKARCKALIVRPTVLGRMLRRMPVTPMSVAALLDGHAAQVEFRQIVEEIFPESELPTLEQICQACDGLFELALLQNDREDYSRTCRVWSDRLRAARGQAVTVAGEAVAIITIVGAALIRDWTLTLTELVFVNPCGSLIVTWNV